MQRRKVLLPTVCALALVSSAATPAIAGQADQPLIGQFETTLSGEVVDRASIGATKGRSPQGMPSSRPRAKKRTAAEGDVTVAATVGHCYYYKGYGYGNPPPPGSGNSYAIARGDGSASPFPMYTQATSSLGGTNATTDTRRAIAQTGAGFKIADWPQPAQVRVHFNPSYTGAMRLDSNIAPFTFATSEGSGRMVLNEGVSRDDEIILKTKADLSRSLRNGTGQTYKFSFPGYADGADSITIDMTPNHTYYGFVETQTTATAASQFLAGASAQVDFGSAGIDAPAVAPGGRTTFTNSALPYMYWQYILPDGYTLTTCGSY